MKFTRLNSWGRDVYVEVLKPAPGSGCDGGGLLENPNFEAC